MNFTIGELQKMLDDSVDYTTQNLPPVVLEKFFQNYKHRDISDEDGATLGRNLVAIAKQLRELQPDYPEIDFMIDGYEEFWGNRKRGDYFNPGDHTAMFADQLVSQKCEITRKLIELLVENEKTT
jgi:hypothetical protein